MTVLTNFFNHILNSKGTIFGNYDGIRLGIRGDQLFGFDENFDENFLELHFYSGKIWYVDLTNVEEIRSFGHMCPLDDIDRLNDFLSAGELEDIWHVRLVRSDRLELLEFRIDFNK